MKTLIALLLLANVALADDAKQECAIWMQWTMMAHEYMESGLKREGWIFAWDDAEKEGKAREILDALYSHSLPPAWLKECFGEKT